MKMIETNLPWSGAPALTTREVRDRLAGRLGPAAQYLPKQVMFFCDPGVRPADAEASLAKPALFLFKAMAIRTGRRPRMTGSACFKPYGLEEWRTGQKHRQTWALY